jgi:hypothetical protein
MRPPPLRLRSSLVYANWRPASWDLDISRGTMPTLKEKLSHTDFLGIAVVSERLGDLALIENSATISKRLLK